VVLRCSSVGEEGAKIKLPVVQIIEKSGELVGEFICGNDMANAMVKLKATVESLEKSVSCPTVGSMGGVDNIYSDDQMDDIIARGENTLVLKLYRDGCKKCATMEPVFASMALNAKNPHFRYLQAEVSNVPLYTKSLKQRLTGTA